MPEDKDDEFECALKGGGCYIEKADGDILRIIPADREDDWVPGSAEPDL